MSQTQNVMIAEVVVDRALDRPLDYSIPEELLSKALIGRRALVTLRGKECYATIVSLKKESAFSNIQPILSILENKTSLSGDLLALAHWMSNYYATRLQKIFKTLLPPSIHTKIEIQEKQFVEALVSMEELRRACLSLREKQGAQAAVLDVLLANPKGILLSKLLEIAECSKSPVTSLEKKKLLTCRLLQVDRLPSFECDFFPTKPKLLNQEQKSAFDKIASSLTKGSYETHLLFGITGSGKTEVYLQAMEHALKENKGVIFLVPEIALTSQTLERITARFQSKIALLHHRLKNSERCDTFRLLQEGKLNIVIGARSAIFSPVLNLGLIIVDEEHDGAYKQTDEMPCYNARDIAVMRGKLCGATVILGSATPSLESYHNAQIGKYSLSSLGQRAETSSLPQVSIVDMKHECEKQKGFTLFSDPLLRALKKRLEVGEQTLLFLNRRGFHTMRLCKECSHVIRCDHCAVSLTYHKESNLLSCHLCNHTIPSPRECPQCRSQESLQFKGAGTEQVQKALHAMFPTIRTLRLDGDTTKHLGSHDLIFKQFRSGKADVLIGTQMIAKGLHFPSVTLVGVLNADAGLYIPDFRQAETTFQLITQVSGRSGRSSLPGEVIIQTFLKEHPAITTGARQDYPLFFEQECAIRKEFGYPPFSRLIKIVFLGAEEDLVQQWAETFRQELIAKLSKSALIHPVTPSGIPKIKDLFRYQFFIRDAAFFSFGQIVDQIRSRIKIPSHIKWCIDVDPSSLF